jgi:hypothetical protein
VALDKFLTSVFGCTRQRCSGCPGALPSIQRMLDARFLDFRYSFKISLYCHCLLPHHSTTDCNRFCVSSSSHTHKALSIILRKGSQQLTEQVLHWITGLLASSDICIFLDETNCSFIYPIMVSKHSSAHSSVKLIQHHHLL